MAGTVTTTKTASWGVTTAIGSDSPVTGVVTDYEDACEPVLAPEQNEVGSTINQTMYDKHYTCSFTVQVAASTAKPPLIPSASPTSSSVFSASLSVRSCGER